MICIDSELLAECTRYEEEGGKRRSIRKKKERDRERDRDRERETERQRDRDRD